MRNFVLPYVRPGVRLLKLFGNEGSIWGYSAALETETPCSAALTAAESANFTGLVLGCIEADFCNQTFV